MQISGNLFIKQFLHLLTRLKPAENITEQYMEKVLHAVFFFGRLNRRQMTPDDFLEPSFSQRLEPSEFIFRAAVVAYSFYKEPQKEAGFPLFYGASLSCKGLTEKKIMISILCLRMWHKAVAFAVYHGQDNQAIVFPDEVKCRAFCYSNGAFTEKPPCVNCKMMYHVAFQPFEGDNRENVQWPHGNCAENECLSKLLQGVPGLQERVVSTDTSVIHNPPQNTYQAIEQEFANSIEANLTNQLIMLLQTKNFPHLLQFFEP